MTIKTLSKTPSTYTVTVASSPTTTISYIKISFIMYNLNNTLFASDGGFILSTLSSSSPVYVKIHNNFAPLKYWIVGIDNIEIKTDGKGFVI
jgi:hypothetical protein